MKQYIAPEAEMIRFSLKDCILSSVIDGDESKVESGVIEDPDAELLE